MGMGFNPGGIARPIVGTVPGKDDFQVTDADTGGEKNPEGLDSGLLSSAIGQMGDEKSTGSESGTGVDFAGLAKSSYGDLELNKYLYETGLQNIFDDYQKNIALLSKGEQGQLQQAYFIREMSKKYLGEYASNIGAGDVSGNLIDIYSKYQQNVNEINQNYDALELNLNTEYQTARNEQFNDIMLNQFNIEVAKLNVATQNIIFNIQTGNTGGLDNFAYLKQQYDAGNISQSDYQAIYGSLSELDASNGEAPIELVNYRDASSESFQPNFDPTYYMSGSENVGLASDVFRMRGEDGSLLPQEYVQILDNVENDVANPRTVTFDVLDAKYDEISGLDNLKDGDTVKYAGTYYTYKNNQWFRLAETTGSVGIEKAAQDNQHQWYADAGTKGKVDATSQDSNKSFKTNGKQADTLEVNGIVYVEDYENGEYSTLDATTKNSLDSLFTKVHGNKNSCVVYFQGRFWERNAWGNIVPMKKQTATEE